MLGDLRYALRLFRKSPTFTLTAVATLALGIGANVAVFGLIDRVVLHPLELPDPTRLVILQRHFSGSQYVQDTVLYDDWPRSRSAVSTMSGVAAFGRDRLAVTYADD